MEIVLSVNKDCEEVAVRRAGRAVERVATVTAELVVTYLKPVTTPQTVCFTARFYKIEERKRWIKGTIQDGSGIVLAKGDSIFVEKRREKL
jgi:acyl-CoA thioesterase FadM